MKEVEPGNFLSSLYFKYIVETSIYMLEPWERKVFNIAMVLILVMSLYTGWVFLPHHTVIQHSLGLLASLFNGSSEGDLQTASPATGEL
ncbi:hypothetical protein BOX15_Mlig014030g3 [Macrostomum lignano]|uniref:Serine palmitoyltransferase small subunit B n=1 Tax=Macrostomum lignano TaxID=282301 RepID=A0A267FMU8_9PLAT|nr:hypothetical protein BOX15_Mlig014030g3 [Macrostomum lignano]